MDFACVGQDNRLPDGRVREKFPRSQHRPSLITPPMLKIPTVIQWSFGTFAMLVESAFDFLQVTLLRDCLLWRQQTSRTHPSNFARAHYLQLNNVSQTRSVYHNRIAFTHGFIIVTLNTAIFITTGVYNIHLIILSFGNCSSKPFLKNFILWLKQTLTKNWQFWIIQPTWLKKKIQ